jgi:NADPH:quinone reductase-like Zn-dependent oxidoreductase
VNSPVAKPRRRGRRIFAVALVGVVLLLAAAIVAMRVASAPKPVAYSDLPMQAVTHEQYGPPDQLRVGRGLRPVPGDGQVLVEVVAVSVNPLDWHYSRGTPYVMRIESGFLSPRDHRAGVDVAGRVVAVGPGVTRFKPGDEVFGGAPGAFAEYALAGEKRLAHKPANLSFEQAAAVPIAAITALQGLRDKGGVQPGDRVLVNGASGGVGTFAVQIAKAMGAHVTGVSSGRNTELVRSLGADVTIDYTREDFTRAGERYDVVLDLVGNRSLAEVRNALAPGGIHVLIGGGGPDDGKWLGPVGKMLAGLVTAKFTEQRFTSMIAEIKAEDLTYLADLMQQGRLTPVLDRTYGSLAEVPTALAYLERGRARGKVVVTVQTKRGEDTVPAP